MFYHVTDQFWYPLDGIIFRDYDPISKISIRTDINRWVSVNICDQKEFRKSLLNWFQTQNISSDPLNWTTSDRTAFLLTWS